jgi:hypothetical protein
MTKSNPKTQRENFACYAALLLVFGTPILGILQALGAFSFVVIVGVAFFLIKAYRVA